MDFSEHSIKSFEVLWDVGNDYGAVILWLPDVDLPVQMKTEDPNILRSWLWILTTGSAMYCSDDSAVSISTSELFTNKLEDSPASIITDTPTNADH